MPTARVNAIDLFYHDDDFADPWIAHDTIFIQHGFCRNSNFWYAWVPHLTRDFRVIRMDLRGCGQSGDPGPDYKYNIEGFISDFLGLLDAIHVDKVHYIGESLGGIIGVASASRHPERFHSLTIVGGVIPNIGGNPLITRGGYSSWEETERDLREKGMKHWWTKSRGLWGELTDNKAMDDYFAGEFARTPVHVAVAISQAVPTIDLTQVLGTIKIPTLVLAQPKRALGLIPGAREKVYEKGSVAMHYLMADTLAKDTLEFLREVAK